MARKLSAPVEEDTVVPVKLKKLPTLGDMDRARIAVVCDAPSQKSWDKRLPISDGALNLFADTATECDFKKDDFFFIAPCPPIPEEIEKNDRRIAAHALPYQAQVHSIIEDMQPDLVIFMGKWGGRVLTGKSVKITKARGTFTSVNVVGVDYPVLPLLSPGHVYHRPELKDIFSTDFMMAMRLRDRKYDLAAVQEDISDTKDYRWCTDLSELLADPPELMSVDTETTGLKWWTSGTDDPEAVKVLTVQLGLGKGRVLVVPMDCDYYPELTPKKRAKLLGQLRKLLENPEIRKTGHNFKYDTHVLREDLKIYIDYDCDTQLLAFVVDENMQEKSLDECVRRWVPRLAGYNDELNKKLDKENMRSTSHEDMLEYGGGDADASFDLALRLTRLGKKDARQWNCYQRIILPAIKAFCDPVELYGVRVNTKVLTDLERELAIAEREQYDVLIGQVPASIKRKHAAKGLKFSRADFLIDILFTKQGLGLKPRVFTDSTAKLPEDQRKPSVSAKEHLPFFIEHPFVAQLSEYVKLEKLRSTYVGVPYDEKKKGPTGFWQYIHNNEIHPSFILHRTVTGRVASFNPNGQNFPKRGKLAKTYRKIFVARKGYRFIECVAEGTLVDTGNGLVPIEKVDKAVTHTGKKMPVIKRKMVGIRQTYNVYAADGSFIRATGNHPMYVVRNGQFMWVEVKNLQQGDYLVALDGGITSGWDDEAYWAGQFLGDGCFSKPSLGSCYEAMDGSMVSRGGYYRINFAFGNDVAEMKPLADHFFGISGRHYSRGDTIYQRKGLYNKWKERVPKNGAKNVQIPDWIMAGSVAQRRACLAGLIDSDGSYHSRRMTLCSISENLIRQVHQLGRSIGVHGVIRYVKSTKAWCWDVFEQQSLARLPDGLLKRKIRAKRELLTKTFSQCRTARVPAELLEATKKPKMQSVPCVNRMFSNSRRNGYSARDAVEKAANYYPEFGQLLKYRYIPYAFTDTGKKLPVWDIEVKDDHSFIAGGLITHNCDLSQAELRIAAWMANEKNMIRIYKAGGDIHATTAAHTMGLTIEQFNALDRDTKKAKRQQAKAINFGFVFGMWWKKFKIYAKTDYGVDFTDEEAQKAREDFFTLYPGLAEWQEQMRDAVNKHGYVRALHGAVRHLPSIRSPEDYIKQETQRQAINSPVQRFASDIGLMAMVRLTRDADPDIIRPLLFIHDALVVEVREEFADEARGWVKWYFESAPLEEWFDIVPPLPIVADVSMGYNLGEMEECEGIKAVKPPFAGVD